MVRIRLLASLVYGSTTSICGRKNRMEKKECRLGAESQAVWYKRWVGLFQTGETTAEGETALHACDVSAEFKWKMKTPEKNVRAQGKCQIGRNWREQLETEDAPTFRQRESQTGLQLWILKHRCLEKRIKFPTRGKETAVNVVLFNTLTLLVLLTILLSWSKKTAIVLVLFFDEFDSRARRAHFHYLSWNVQNAGAWLSKTDGSSRRAPPMKVYQRSTEGTSTEANTQKLI